jgi:hypothetical protein
MATTPEGKVKNAVRALLKQEGIWFYQPVQNGMGVVGIPDFICCHHGRFLAIETKAPGKRNNLTPNQRRVLDQIAKHGGDSIVVDNIDDLKSTLLVRKIINVLEGKPK